MLYCVTTVSWFPWRATSWLTGDGQQQQRLLARQRVLLVRRVPSKGNIVQVALGFAGKRSAVVLFQSLWFQHKHIRHMPVGSSTSWWFRGWRYGLPGYRPAWVVLLTGRFHTSLSLHFLSRSTMTWMSKCETSKALFKEIKSSSRT